jgi:hypothetical protein
MKTFTNKNENLTQLMRKNTLCSLLIFSSLISQNYRFISLEPHIRFEANIVILEAYIFKRNSELKG